MNKILDQETNDEITYLSDDLVQRAYAQYARVMEIIPPPASDVTTEQLACMGVMVNRTFRQPYADFTVWGKHGTHSLRRNSSVGLPLQAVGTYKTLEILGPGSFEA